MAYFEYKPQTPIYQYCSIQSFISIISSKALWLSNIRKSNDPRELVFSISELNKLFKKIQNSGKNKFDINMMIYVEKEIIGIFENSNIFCACFSLNRDSLPLWKAYGEEGCGVCIGFKPTSLSSIPARVQKVAYKKHVDIERMEYDIIYHLNKYISRSIRQDLDLIELKSSIATIATSTKHLTWDHEREVRVVFMQPKQNMTNFPVSRHEDGENIYQRKILIRKGTYGNIEYIEFPFGKKKQSEIDASESIYEVIRGQNCKISANEIDLILKNSGFHGVKIVNSECLVR